MIDNPELLWAAGFWDGEGHASYDYRHNPDGYLCLTVAQAESGLEALRRFHRAVKLGAIKGPYGPYGGNGKWQPSFRWTLAGSKAVIVAQMLAPHVSQIKRAQFQLEDKDYQTVLDGAI